MHRYKLLEELSQQKHAEASESNKSVVALQQKFNNVDSWLSQIGEAILLRHNEPGTNSVSAKDFLDVHEELDREVRAKAGEVNALPSAVNNIGEGVVTGAELRALHERAEQMIERHRKLQFLVEQRIKVGIVNSNFHRLAGQLTQSMTGLEETMRSVLSDPETVDEEAVKNTEMKLKQVMCVQR